MGLVAGRLGVIKQEQEVAGYLVYVFMNPNIRQRQKLVLLARCGALISSEKMRVGKHQVVMK